MKILMVCLGNICRSPLAQGILRHKAKGTDIETDSAGTANYHVGDPPDPRSIFIARKYDINISDLRGRQFETEDFDRFDKIYVMDSGNYERVIALARNDEDRTKVDFIMNEVEEGIDTEVPDPYYGGDMGFENVYTMLDKATDSIIEKHHNGGK